jgi:hypothetical protein
MGLVRIRDVLNGKFYRIPDYQRSYAWEQRQVRELFQDLVEAAKEEITHFLGTVVFSQTSKRNEYFVVDGQQRLTSLILLLRELIEKLPLEDQNFYRRLYIFDEGRFRLEPQEKDRTFFFDLLSGKSPVPTTKSQRLLGEAKEEFRRMLSEFNLDPKKFLKVIEETQLLEFIEEKEGLAIKIFQTVNDRGKSLSFLEKIKSYLIYISYRYLKNRHKEMINQLFGEIFEAYDEIKTLGEELNIELIKRASFTEDNILRFHFILFSPEDYDATPESIFNFLKRDVDNFRRSQNWTEMDRFISSYAKGLYSVFINLRDIVRRVKKEKLYYEIFVWLGLSATLYPLFIALEKRGFLEHEVPLAEAKGKTFLELLRDIDIKVYKTRGTNPRADISRFAYNVNAGEFSKEEIARWLLNYGQQWMSAEDFSLRLERNIYGNEAVPYLLLKYSEKLRSRPYSLEELKSLISLNLTIEHILSQDPNFDVRAYGFESEEDYLEHRDRLGNLTLLSKGLNSQARNKAPLAKADYYDRETSLLEITKALATNIRSRSGFTKQDLIDRTKKIASFVKSFIS